MARKAKKKKKKTKIKGEDDKRGRGWKSKTQASEGTADGGECTERKEKRAHHLDEQTKRNKNTRARPVPPRKQTNSDTHPHILHSTYANKERGSVFGV